ncbi:Bacteriophytochrome (Light-regulated signal transduction histidine kinase), PhyB2 [Operophtera brumata]|uniref:Bacteriophytochrome (Light-regulated signal transduction histidine kinase), PhyB2 n=1 Tax=Operophtera brumata TaxID=104452 RepID=A0A0L7KT10_OPEBR|nr:Bacteriophytochrome (Light-regulated signal transduction histidine kinase), PhyB2 [Operophtera brumata]
MTNENSLIILECHQQLSTTYCQEFLRASRIGIRHLETAFVLKKDCRYFLESHYNCYKYSDCICSIVV